MDFADAPETFGKARIFSVKATFFAGTASQPDLWEAFANDIWSGRCICLLSQAFTVAQTFCRAHAFW